MSIDKIVIKGARENNLKNIDISLPRDKLIVFTGPSGSGKSSLAFDTIYAEGQRRYVESLSAYARQFLGQMEKPEVEYIEGLSPAISIDQKTTNKNPRSTVGTVTEIYDYLRLLFARVGKAHCTVCKREIEKQTIDQIVDRVMTLKVGEKIQILSPIIRSKKGEHRKEIEGIKRNGYVRVRVDGNMYDISETIELDKNKKHSIEVIIDRLVVKPEIRERLSDSIQTAVALSDGLVLINIFSEDRDIMFSQNYSCPDHDICIDEISPSMFSFNNPKGACENCMGIGTTMKINEKKLIVDENFSINQGGIRACGWDLSEGQSIGNMYIQALSERYKFKLDIPIKKLKKTFLDIIFYGNKGEELDFVHKHGVYKGSFEGIVNNLERRYKETQSSAVREDIAKYMTISSCSCCKGERLNAITLGITVGGINISKFSVKSVEECIDFIELLKLSKGDMKIADRIIEEIKKRLLFLKSVGLDYLTLSRSAATLSGGESQRIRLATQIGSSLVGVLYILDEPSIGLHQKDNMRLIETLKHLRDIGNTVIVVEHDEDTMKEADYIVDIGPGAGVHGGEIIFAGTVEGIKKCDKSETGRYLNGEKSIPVPENRRLGLGKKISIKGAKANNLKDVDVEFPIGTLSCVTGVSGSGKSTLINEILYKYASQKINRAKDDAGEHKSIEGIENFDKIIGINQSPIGRTPRSNPATYTGVFTDIREIFAATNDAKSKGFISSRFSFNIKGGRCESCQGDGIIKIEMHFLSDIFVTCEVCKGHRYNRDTLSIKYKDKNIYDILEMTVEQGGEFFKNIPKIYRKLKCLEDVGLGYIKIGQSAPSLSGGESQRVKLATELSKISTGKTLYILDEPTTGLHVSDVANLIKVLQKLVEMGNTMIIIEHNLDIIKTADYIVDIGPEGGHRGGRIIGCGTPEDIAENKDSYTGLYLKKILYK